ncbi:hypothetical protein [Moellerella wisconsensis]|uniref:hypothetical protein n=1 Tax=Moellerella wisconsensis TaxID=158849 RepID=UPI00240F18ED|nr:hypothetical protein [Moellerella wisconsensis]
MEFKGTPAPWVTLPEECDRPYIRVRGTVLGGRYKVANVLTPNHEGVDPREAKETRANAHLIAAAPELLEALIELTESAKEAIDGLGNLSGAIDTAKAAIAKALGQQ